MRWLAVFLALGLAGCSWEPAVESGNREQILHLSNGTEPEDIDPHMVTGIPEHNIITSMTEGLVSEDPVDLHPVPGVAERWDKSEDGLVYTFYFRTNALWSNGDPVTAEDFVRSYQRILTPALGSEYAYMLYVMKNAEEYQSGKLKDFEQVGVKALDPGTLQIILKSSTPYFLSLLNHYTWFPVPVRVVEKCGPLFERGNRWTRPGNFVGNGPFRLVRWQLGDVMVVEKNPLYWDAARVRLKEIHFYATDSAETQERAFRARQLHNTYTLLGTKVDSYRRNHKEVLHTDPWLASYFYRINTRVPPTNDKRVRQALNMAIDRKDIVERVTRAGQLATYSYSPPGNAGYTPRAKLKEDVAAAKRLLAEAGYPEGKNFPTLQILYNSDENHRAIAEAIQEMWRKNLNIDVTLANQEWKVYLDAQRKGDYQIARAGWTGDYMDPNTFMDMWTSWSQQNQTGWANKDYDDLVIQASQTQDLGQRLEVFQKAEALLLDELPIVPIYIYTRPYLLDPSVKGWYANILDHHPYNYIYLEPTTRTTSSVEKLLEWTSGSFQSAFAESGCFP